MTGTNINEGKYDFKHSGDYYSYVYSQVAPERAILKSMELAFLV